MADYLLGNASIHLGSNILAVYVKIMGAADGSKTPHDGRWVQKWNPHTKYGVLAVDSTSIKSHARPFKDSSTALIEWNTISDVQPFRPDMEYNKPLTAVNIYVENDNEPSTTH